MRGRDRLIWTILSNRSSIRCSPPCIDIWCMQLWTKKISSTTNFGVKSCSQTPNGPKNYTKTRSWGMTSWRQWGSTAQRWRKNEQKRFRWLESWRRSKRSSKCRRISLSRRLWNSEKTWTQFRRVWWLFLEKRTNSEGSSPWESSSRRSQGHERLSSLSDI